MKPIVKFLSVLSLSLFVLTGAYGVAPVITGITPDSVELNSPWPAFTSPSPYVPYQITTNTDGTAGAPILYNATGLPAGLTLDALNGEISGAPTEPGTFNVTLSATNGLDETGTAVLVLTVTDPLPPLPVITSDAAISAAASSPFTYTITATNNPTSFSVIGLGALPTDAVDTTSLSTTGAFTFTPSASAVGDSFNLLVTATNAAGPSPSQLLKVTVIPAVPPAPSVPTVTIVGVPVVDYAQMSLTIEAEVTLAAGADPLEVGIDSVLVRWTNPPAGANSPEITLETMTLGATVGTTTSYTGVVTLGFNPNDRELGAGDIDLEVVAFQTNAVNAQDYGSDAVSIEIEPLAQFIFPTAGFTVGGIDVGDVFASVLINTNDFASVTARISGGGLPDTVSDFDNSDNQNGVFTFAATQAINFPGDYLISITVEDGNGETTEIARTLTISENPTAPAAVIVQPITDAFFEVFTPALVEMDQVGSGVTDNLDAGGVLESKTFTFDYATTLISGGQGYFPLDDTSFGLLGQVSGGGAIQIAGATLAGGRVLNVPGTLSYSLTRTVAEIALNGPWLGFGLNPLVVLDSPVDPGSPAQITIAAEFIPGGAPLASFKILVNGEDVTPGNGNLNILSGALDAPLIKYPAVGAPAPGNYVLLVEVTDQNGQVASAISSFEVENYNPAPTVGIDSPASGDSIRAGETLEITVIAEDTNKGGFITTVEIFNNAVSPSVSLGFANPTGTGNEYLLSYRTSAADLGNLNLQARAVDNQGNVGYSAVIDYSVVQGAVPTVSITSPDNGDVFLINTPISLAITADDGDDSIVSVEVFSNGTSVGFASSLGGDQYEFTLTATATAGLQRLTAVATDELGNRTTSSEVNVLLTSGAAPIVDINEVNGVAVVDPQLTPVVAARGSVVTLAIAASDNDGTVTQVEVYNGAVPVGFATLVAPDTYRFDYQASSPGLVKFQVRASDDLGNIGFSDLVEVSVVTGFFPFPIILSPDSGDSLKAGETLEITVLAFDLDGFITSVGIFNNDVLLGLANPTGTGNEYLLSYRTSAADLGNLNLQARAIDNQGNVGYSAVIDYSVVQGAVPTVSITSPDNGDVFLINTPISLAITADDGDDSIVSVEVFSNGTSVGFASSLGGDQYEFTLTATATAGLQRLTAVATDELGNRTTSSEVNVLLTSGAAPIVDINEVNGVAVVDPQLTPVVAARGSVVTLAIAASDNDGTVTQVEVYNGAVPVGFATLVAPDTYRFDYQASSPGLVKFQVRASDDLGNVGFSDLVEVSVVTGDIPTVGITSPASGDSIRAGETLEITVTATDAGDGFITSVEIFNNAVSLGLANPTGVAGAYLLSYRTSAADLGNLNLQARAIDNQGNVGFSAVVDFSVVQGVVPTVDIVGPANGDVFFINTPITLELIASHADTANSIVTVEVFSNGTSVGFASATGVDDDYEFVLTATAAAGLQRLTAVATDELGNRTTSSEVNVLLTSGAAPIVDINEVNGVAVVDPQLTPVVAARGSVVTLAIAASDNDGTVTQVEVYNGAVPVGFATLVAPDTYRFDYQASSPGLVKFQVRASDDLGNVGFSDLVEVSVVTGDIPTVGITSPASGDSIRAGETLEITVTATDAGDGFITSVEIFNNAVSLGLANPTGVAGAYLLSYRTSAADLGNLNLQARAIDNQGNVGFSAVVDFSVVQGVVPTVDIVGPANGDVFFINTPITLELIASHADTANSIVTVEVFSNGTSVGFASATGVDDDYEFVLTATAAAGLQRLTAVATDELGNRTTSSEVNVLLTSGAAPIVDINEVNGVAVVDPQLTPVVAARGSVVTLAIAASDNDGTVTQVEVYNGAVPVGFATLVAPDTYRFDYQASSPGLVKFQVRASDDLGNVGFSDLVEVSVVTGFIPFPNHS